MGVWTKHTVVLGLSASVPSSDEAEDEAEDTSWKSPSSTVVPLPSSSMRSKDPSAPTTSRISMASGLGLPDLGRHAASRGMIAPSGASTGICARDRWSVSVRSPE